MDRVTLRASEALFAVVAGAEPRLEKLRGWYTSTLLTIDKWYKSEGNNGVSRAKDCFHWAWLRILGGNPPALSFVKSSESGVPALVEPLVQLVLPLRKTARLMSAVLSIVRMTDLFEGQYDKASIDKALANITEPRVSQKARKVMDEFARFIDSLLATPAYDRYPFIKSIRQNITIMGKKDTEYHPLGNKRGPNGPLLENYHLDEVTTRRCQTSSGRSLNWELDNLRHLICDFQADTYTVQPNVRGLSLRTVSDEELLMGLPRGRSLATCPGKLSLKREKSGKLRIIAMPDGLTQESIRPLGDWLRDILRSLPSDCTFDQGAAIPKIQEWQAEGRTCFSFDQTACTDLFPIDAQLILLEKRFNKSLSESVRTVLTDREWEITYPKSGVVKHVRWSVGQPLGVYASWPLMAVTHHLLVQFASYRCSPLKSRWVPFDDYAICGDDIVIGSWAVAHSYLKIVTALGMRINMTKSYVSGPKSGNITTPVSEFAKRVVWNSKLLYPIKPKEVRASIQDWRLAVPLLWEFTDKNKWALSLPKTRKLIRRYYFNGSRYLEFLLTTPHVCGGVGLRDGIPLRTRSLDSIHGTHDVHPWLHYLAKVVRSRLLANKSGRFLSGKIVREERTPSFMLLEEPIMRRHPAYKKLLYEQGMADTIYDIQRGLTPGLQEVIKDLVWFGRESQYIKVLSEYVVERPQVWEDSKPKAIRTSNSWRKVLDKPYHLDDEILVVSSDLTLDQYQQMSDDDRLSYWIDLQVGSVTDIIDYLSSEAKS